MGRTIAKRMRKTLAAALAVCLTVSMVPAMALGEVTVDGNTTTTVKVEVNDTFAVTEASIWGNAISIADSKQAGFEEAGDQVSAGLGMIWARFQHGRAKDWDGLTGHFDATWTWERTVQSQDGTSSTTTTGKTVKTTVQVSGNQTDPAVAKISMNDLFAVQGWTSDAQRPGNYKVKLALEGNNCSLTHEFSFVIVNADEVLNTLTDEEDSVTITGAFSLTSQLNAVNLKTATSAEQQAMMDALTHAAADQTINAAFQLSIVNGGLFYDDTPSFVQESVEFPVGNEIMQAAAHQADLTLLKNADNTLTQDVYRYDSAAGVYKKVLPNGQLSATDTLTLTALGQGGMVKFAMPFTSANIGAVALAYRSVVNHTVEVRLAGAGAGSAQPAAGSYEYGAGSQPSFTFYAETGSVLAGIEITSNGVAYPSEKYEMTSNAVRFKALDADVRVVATFEKFTGGVDPENPDRPVEPGTKIEPLALAWQQVGGVTGLLTASYTQLVPGEGDAYTLIDASQTSDIAPNGLTDVAPGTQVRLDVSAPEGYVIDGVWVFGADVPESEKLTDAHKVTIKGATVVIPTMTPDTTNVVVRYVAGDKPSVTTFTLNALVDGDPTAGVFADMTPQGTGRYTATMVKGDYQVITVESNSGWAIAQVDLYDGLTPAGEPRTLFSAAGDDERTSFSYTIQAVDRNQCAVAKFKKVGNDPGPGPVVPSDPEKSYTVTAKVHGVGGSISPAGSQQLRAGANQTFTVVPDDGYTVDTVRANGHTVGLTRHENGYWFFEALEISSNLTIVATFKQSSNPNDQVTEQPISVSVKSLGFGRAYPVGVSKVAKGRPFTVTLEPNDGCALKSLTMNGIDVTGDVNRLSYTVASLDVTTEFLATFVDENGSTVGGGSEGPDDDDDIYIDVDIDVDVSIETAQAQMFGMRARAGMTDEVGGDVTPKHVKLKKGMTQEFIIKPANGSYLQLPVTVNGARILEQGNIDMGEPQVSPDGVNKPYYRVVLGDFTSTSVKLNVKFASCYKDPANTAGDRYIYDQAAGRVVDTTPDINGDVEVIYPNNNPEGVVTPGGNTNPDGTSPSVVDATVKPSGDDPIDRIEMGDHTLDIVYDENGNITEIVVDGESTDPNFPPKTFPVKPVGDKDAEKDALDKATEEFNKRVDQTLGYEPPRGSGEDGRPDYVKPGTDDNGNFDGSFDVKIPTGNKDGEPIDPGFKVETDGSDQVLYQYLVQLGFADDSEAAGGTVRVERNGVDVGQLEAAGRSLPMNHEGELVLHATPNEGYGVKFIVKDGEGNIRASDGNVVALADLNAQADETAPASAGMTKSYVVTGPGTVHAQFYRTGGGNDSSSSDSSSSGSSSGGNSSSSGGNSSSSGGNQGGNNGSSGDNGGTGDGLPDASLGAGDLERGTAYAVTARAEGHGSISPSGTNYYRVGKAATFTMAPQTGYQVTAVIVDGKRQAYTGTKFTLAAQQGGTSHTVVAEFSPIVPAAGTTTTGGRVLRTMTSLASTGDGQAAIAFTLAGVACAAVGTAILVNGRRRREEEADAAVLVAAHAATAE